MNLSSKHGGEGLVGGRQMQHTSWLQAEWQSLKQVTHPNEQCEASGSQVQ